MTEHGDTCVDDRGPEDEPFRVYIWQYIDSKTGDMWVPVTDFSEQRPAEKMAKSLAGEQHSYHGVTRHNYPLP